MLAHTLARVVDAVDSRPSRNGDGIAHSCHRNSMCKRGARCGAGSRTLAFLDPLVWHGASVRTVGGGAMRDAAMQGQVRFITRPKSRTMRAKRNKRSRANRTNVPK